MTPTLFGRWQIRFFLLGTSGLIIALVIGMMHHDMVTPLLVLLYVLVLGVAWDVLYQYIVSFRWDRDWPTTYQIAAGVVEGALLWGLIQTGRLPGVAPTLPFVVYLAQYALTWLSIFLLTQGLLRIVWPKWRYQGGQWLVFHAPEREAASQPVAVPRKSAIPSGASLRRSPSGTGS